MSFFAQRPAPSEVAARDHAPHRGTSPSRPLVAVFLVLLILFGLAAAGYWACQIDIPQAPVISLWRRTPTGWEKCSSWPTAPAPRDPRLHPLTVAAWLAAAGSLALLALSPDKPSGRRVVHTRRTDAPLARDATQSAR